MTSTKAFREAVEKTVPHLGDDKYEGTCWLVLESDGTNLFVAATDRYTIAAARLPIDNTIPWKAMLNWQAVKKLQATWSALGNSVSFVHDPDRHRLRLGSDDSVITLSTMEPTMRPPSVDEDGIFDWRLIIRRQLEKAPADISVDMSTSLLARWKHLGDTATFWATGETSPVMVVADDFIGGQMPVRHEGGVEAQRQEQVNSWLLIVGKHAHYDGVDYDLSRTYLDQDDDPWEFVRTESVTGEPLMNIPGLDGGELTLAELVELYGPLRAGAKI